MKTDELLALGELRFDEQAGGIHTAEGVLVPLQPMDLWRLVADMASRLRAASEPRSITVWTLRISTEHGDDVSLHTSEEDADAGAFAFVEEWWDRELPGTTMPTDKHKAVSAYFNNVDGESYDIEPHIVSV